MARKPPEEREYARLKRDINIVTLARLVAVLFAIRHAIMGEWSDALIMLGFAYLLRVFLPVTR